MKRQRTRRRSPELPPKPSASPPERCWRAGVLATLAAILESQFAREAVVWLGQPPLRPRFEMTTLSAPWHLAYLFFLGPPQAVLFSLSALFFLYLFYVLSKRTWLARLLLFLVFLGPSLASAHDLRVALVSGAIFAAIWVALLVRFGLLSSSVFMFTLLVLQNTPLTLDWSAWYAGRSFAVLGFFTLLLLAAFYTSLGGKPLFGKALLED